MTSRWCDYTPRRSRTAVPDRRQPRAAGSSAAHRPLCDQCEHDERKLETESNCRQEQNPELFLPWTTPGFVPHLRCRRSTLRLTELSALPALPLRAPYSLGQIYARRDPALPHPPSTCPLQQHCRHQGQVMVSVTRIWMTVTTAQERVLLHYGAPSLIAVSVSRRGHHATAYLLRPAHPSTSRSPRLLQLPLLSPCSGNSPTRPVGQLVGERRHPRRP